MDLEVAIKIPLDASELKLVAAAAKRANLSVEAYARQVVLRAAQTRPPARVIPPELVECHRGIIAAYHRALDYTDNEPGRTAKEAATLAKAGATPNEIGLVMVWIRETDWRYRNGKHMPLAEVVRQWPAWARQHVRATGASGGGGISPAAAVDLADLFGTAADEF